MCQTSAYSWPICVVPQAVCLASTPYLWANRWVWHFWHFLMFCWLLLWFLQPILRHFDHYQVSHLTSASRLYINRWVRLLFCLSGGMLMTFAIFIVILALIWFLYAYVPMPDAFTSFLSHCGFFGHDFWLLAGEFGFLQWFWGILMHLELSVGLLKSSAMLSMCVHASDASVGLLSLFGLPTCCFALSGR